MGTPDGTTADPDTRPQAWDAAWAEALSRLELDVARTERLLADAHLPSSTALAGGLRAAAWRPPTGLGPLPAALETRARALLDRQADLTDRLAGQLARARRQLAATHTLDLRPARGPVYLDLEG